jgi:hypothetical protein
MSTKLSFENAYPNNDCDSIENIRAIYNRTDSIQESDVGNGYDKSDETDDNEITVNIFRFKFTDDVVNELYTFSKIHQYDHRKDFKTAWEKWVEENNDLVQEETKRLNSLGYDGDVEDKMFKSTRYYFRKKSTDKKEPQERKNYIGVKKELLEKIDEHIKKNINKQDYRPAEGFLDFCKNNSKMLQEEVSCLYNSGIKDSRDIKNKIKKTYKNRYFMFISK